MIIGKVKSDKNAKEHLIDTKLIKIDKEYLLDYYVKLAVLSVIAGYKKSDYIFLNDFLKGINLKKLNSFISYILNHNIAPKRFGIKINQEIKHQKRNKSERKNNCDSVLCFSGGIDSTAGLLYALDRKQIIQPIWIDFGQRNMLPEKNAAKKVLKKLNVDFFNIKVDLNKFIIAGWKDWDFIVPARNFLFLSLANSYLQLSSKKKGGIFLCAHKDEMAYLKNRDKSEYFFKTSSKLFSNNKKEIVATTPFKNYSKSEIISYWRRNWEKKYDISPLDTTTCYYENGCGKCEACLKRAIYLVAGGYKIVNEFKVNPLKDPSEFMKNKWIMNIENNKISRSNKLDFLIAVEDNINIVPEVIRKFYNNLSAQTLSAVSRRRKELDLVKI